MDAIKLGQIIAENRKKLGLTQEELGRRLDVTDKAVSKWERGLNCPDISLLNRLAAELRISLLDLLGDQLGDICQSSNIAGYTAVPKTPYASGLALTLDAEPGPEVSPRILGMNLEHTRSCITTGLAAQMLKNRKFAGKPSSCCGSAMSWYAIGEQAMFSLDASFTRHADKYHMRRSHEMNAQRIVNFHSGEVCGLGQHELSLSKDKPYAFRLIAKSGTPLSVRVALTDRFGHNDYAVWECSVPAGDWSEHECTLIPNASDTDADLRITFSQKATLILGAVSLMPADNFRGMRKDVISCLKEMGVRILRWPGGNFAGEYNWMDGLLPVDMRSPLESYLGIETQPHSMGYDYHEIATDDFIALCREVGAEPFITINPCWCTPEENAAWVEYCNGDATTEYGRLRISRGYEQPYNVRLWSLGNEFGYGHMEGDNSPEGYRKIAEENGKYMLAVCPDLTLCTSGPYPNKDWMERAARPLSHIAPLVSQHYYNPFPRYDAEGDLASDYYTSLAGVENLRQQIREMHAIMPPQMSISMDEWNVWYAWYRPSSVSDGMFAALALHMFMEERDRCGLGLVCHFEAINEGCILVTPENAVLSAQGQIFSIMKHHMGGRSLHHSRQAAATINEDVLTVTMVNAAYDQPIPVSVPDIGGLLRASIYTADTVVPPSFFTEQTITPLRTDGAYTLVMPPHSVLLMQLRAD